MDMLEAVTKSTATLHFSGANFTDFTLSVTHQNAHPADVPETRASLVAVWEKSRLATPDFLPK